MVFAVMRKGKKMCNEQTIQQTDFAEQWITKQAAIDALGDMVMNWTDSEYELGQLNQWKADRKAIIDLPSAQPQLDTCPIYGGMCGYPSNLCYECPRHEGAKERPQWWTEGLQPFAQPRHYHEENLLTYAHDMGVTLEQAKKELTRVSQIAPQRIKGRWERKESDLSWWYECSECGESPLYNPYSDEVLTPFCPWCGAEMRGDEDG